MEAIKEKHAVVRLKNRLDTPTPTGGRDVLCSVAVEYAPGLVHVCEVRLSLDGSPDTSCHAFFRDFLWVAKDAEATLTALVHAKRRAAKRADDVGSVRRRWAVAPSSEDVDAAALQRALDAAGLDADEVRLTAHRNDAGYEILAEAPAVFKAWDWLDEMLQDALGGVIKKATLDGVIEREEDDADLDALMMSPAFGGEAPDDERLVEPLAPASVVALLTPAASGDAAALFANPFAAPEAVSAALARASRDDPASILRVGDRVRAEDPSSVDYAARSRAVRALKRSEGAALLEIADGLAYATKDAKTASWAYEAALDELDSHDDPGAARARAASALLPLDAALAMGFVKGATGPEAFVVAARLATDAEAAEAA